VSFQQIMQPGGRFLLRRLPINFPASLERTLESWPLRLQDAFRDQLARAVHDGNRDRCLVNVHANILFLTHKGAPFRWLTIRTTYRKSGRLFILREIANFRQLRQLPELGQAELWT